MTMRSGALVANSVYNWVYAYKYNQIGNCLMNFFQNLVTPRCSVSPENVNFCFVNS